MSATLWDDPQDDLPEAESNAIVSSNGMHRYYLHRRWSSRGRLACFIMLNPSTADASTDDPTIRRCIGFAKSWGMGGLAVVNLYGLRSTDPKGLWKVDAAQAIGPKNDEWLAAAASIAAHDNAPIIAAWGANAKAERVAAVLRMRGMGRLQALGVTKAGQPRHPLYLRADAERVDWPDAS